MRNVQTRTICSSMNDLIVRIKSHAPNLYNGYRSTCRYVPLAEGDYLHVQWLEVCSAIRIPVEAPETDEIVCSEKFDPLTGFLHLDILFSKGLDPETLIS
jgi:hypothetical protein